jgi:hypothetical protein
MKFPIVFQSNYFKNFSTYDRRRSTNDDVESYPKFNLTTDKSTLVAKKVGDLASHIAHGKRVIKSTYTYDHKIH